MSEEPRRLVDLLHTEDERSFLLAAFDHRLGDAGRLAYAQLLDDRDPERAEWLRLEVALHSRATDDPAVLARFLELARRIGLDFANALLRETIMNCGSDDAKRCAPRVRFAFACSKRWETLTPTGSEAVRHCQQCNESVYYCHTIADAETRAHAGQCIAVPKPLSTGAVSTEMMLGRPDPVRMWADRLFSYGPGAPANVGALVVIYSKHDGQLGRRYTLRPDGDTIGRGADNTIVIDGDAASRHHARLEKRGADWWLIDGGSTNGTHVNDQQIEEARLRDGDRVHVGGTIFKFLDSR